MSQKTETPPLLSAQDALIAIMIAEGLSDENITGREFLSISRIVDHLPIFQEYVPNIKLNLLGLNLIK